MFILLAQCSRVFQDALEDNATERNKLKFPLFASAMNLSHMRKHGRRKKKREK